MKSKFKIEESEKQKKRREENQPVKYFTHTYLAEFKDQLLVSFNISFIYLFDKEKRRKKSKQNPLKTVRMCV